MKHFTRAFCAVLAVCSTSGAVCAQEVVFKEWRYHQPGDLLYDEGVHTAGVILEDYSFAIMVLDAEGKNTAIGAVIPETAFEDSVKSTITMTDGSARTVTVSGDKLRREQPKTDGMVSYSFFISEEDVELFQAARDWTIQAGDQSATFPLAGSRNAVDAARAAQQISAGGPEVREKWIAACDAAAAHPYDSESDAPGVAWEDIDPDTATTACLNAYAAGDVSPRIRFELGRAYDKAGDPRAVEILGKAAQEDNYPIAFNGLATLYWAGTYVQRDPAAARDLLEQGAALGDMVSSYSLGRMLVEHANGDTDVDRGRALLLDAAEAGYPPAQRIYGEWLVDGKLGEGDPQLAQTYLQKAADNGDADAAFALAQLYIGGSGLAPDPVAYLKYLKLAAKGGNDDAIEALTLD
jgi:TPR repeat protein